MSPRRPFAPGGCTAGTVPRVPAALALAACLLLAGCSAVAPTAPTADAPDTDTSPTAEPCPTAEELTARALPDRPDALTADAVTEYVAPYEEATVWNSQYERRHSLTGDMGYTDCQNERLVAGDAVIRTSYFVNNSVLVRLETTDRTADPRDNGTVVERWE